MKKPILILLTLCVCFAASAQTLTLKFSGIGMKSVAPINLKGVSNLVISADSINGGSTNAITLTNCSNITIKNCKISGNAGTFGIFLIGCSNITIQYNYIHNIGAGVYAQNCTGGIVVSYNYMLNMQGPYPHADFIQFNNVSGAGNVISYNNLEDIADQSNPEDAINVYKSNGTAASPILVTNNFIRGGGPSTTGSGITVADQGGSYETITNNIVINSGNIGMQVAGGTYITMTNNTIYSSAFPWSHLGLGYGNYSGVPSTNVTIGNNKVKWMSGKAADLSYYAAGTTQIEKDASLQSGLTPPGNWTTNALGTPPPTNYLTVPLVVFQ